MAVGRCRTAPRSSSAAATTARCGCGGWPRRPGREAADRPRRLGDGGGGGTLPDGTPVIVSGGGMSDGAVRVWRLAATPGRGAADRRRRRGDGGGRGDAAGRHPGGAGRRGRTEAFVRDELGAARC